MRPKFNHFRIHEKCYFPVKFVVSLNIFVRDCRYIFTPFTCTFNNIFFARCHPFHRNWILPIHLQYTMNPTLLYATIIPPIQLVPIHCIYNTTISLTMTGLFTTRFITWQHRRIHDETHSPNYHFHHFPLIPNYDDEWVTEQQAAMISSLYLRQSGWNVETATKITNIEFYECGAPLFCKYPNRECINTSTRLGFCFSGGYLMHHTTPFFLSIYIFLCTHLLMAIYVCVCGHDCCVCICM